MLPLESDPQNFSDHENIPHERLEPVRKKAKKAGLWAPQSPKEYGGMDLPIVAWAVMYEEAARSLFGPLAINCMAPDDGNMNRAEKARHAGAEGKVAQAHRRGQGALVLRHDRAGAGRRLRSEHDQDLCREEGRHLDDLRPQMVHHRRRRSGALHPRARTSDDKRKGITTFLFHKDQPGWRILRRIEIMGPEEHGGHCETRIRRP